MADSYLIDQKEALRVPMTQPPPKLGFAWKQKPEEFLISPLRMPDAPDVAISLWSEKSP